MTESKISTEKPSRKEKKPSGEKATKPLTKVVIRRLPPTMTESTFLEQVQPLPDYDHMYYVSADWSLSVSASCRAYFNFLKMEDVFIFKEKFHGYIFVDAKGNEYPAIVEFAPYQRMGRARSKKVDRKCNTHETCEHYLEFVRTMDTEEVLPKLELKSDFDAKHDNQIRSTPLLEFLNDKKGRRRDRDRKTQQEKKRKILAPIKEDVTGKENPRLAKDKQGGKQQPKDDQAGGAKKERPDRSEKEKARRAEREKVRREKRQQQVVERKQGKEQSKQQKAVVEDTVAAAAVPEKDSSAKKTTEEPKKREPKKYSERRKENRSKQAAEKRSGEAEKSRKSQSTADATEMTTAGKADTQSKPVGEEKKKESRRYSERRVRNKDRPAIQIYQPGGSKVRNADE